MIPARSTWIVYLPCRVHLPFWRKWWEHRLTKDKFCWRACFLLSSLATLAMAGCGKIDPGPYATPVPEVTVTVAHKAPLNDSLRVSGNLAALPNRDAKVSSVVPGRIAAVLVAEGDSVRANQELARLDNPSLHDQLRQADAAVAQASANVENARISEQRNEGLLQRGIAARKE